MELTTLLTEFIAQKASDLHLVVGQPPVFRVEGKLVRRDGETLDARGMETLLMPALNAEQQSTLRENRGDVDTHIQHDNRVFLCHIFRERNGLGAALRVALEEPPTLQDLALDELLRPLLQAPRGLILVTGPSGSGKDTNCAAMLETINRTSAQRIIILRDSILYNFTSKQSVITQRIVGQDVESIEQGLVSAMHSDLDIVYISEIRSMETVRLALAAAETGHLVFSVLNAENASEAIERLIEAFPEPRDTIRRMVARNLVAVTSQRLLPRATPGHRVAAVEILRATPRIRQLISEGQTDLTLAMEAGRDQGMQTLDDSILALYRSGKITYETAWNHMKDHERLGPQAA